MNINLGTPDGTALNGDIFESDEQRIGFVWEIAKDKMFKNVDISYINTNHTDTSSKWLVPGDFYLKSYNSELRTDITEGSDRGAIRTYAIPDKDVFVKEYFKLGKPPVDIVLALDDEDRERVKIVDPNVLAGMMPGLGGINPRSFMVTFFLSNKSKKQKVLDELLECVDRG